MESVNDESAAPPPPAASPQGSPAVSDDEEDFFAHVDDAIHGAGVVADEHPDVAEHRPSKATHVAPRHEHIVQTTIAGYLKKRSPAFPHPWQLRYWQVSAKRQLLYYASEADCAAKEPIDMVDLQHVDAVEHVAGSEEFVLRTHHHRKPRVFGLRAVGADAAATAAAWVECLHANIDCSRTKARRAVAGRNNRETLHTKRIALEQTAEVPKSAAELEFLKGAMARQPLFERMSAAEVGHLAQVARRDRYAKGELVCKQGDEGTTAFVIRRGGLRVEVALPGASEREGEQFSIAYGAGEIVGELSLLYHSLRGATVTAVAETEVFVIDADAFNAVVSLKRVFSKRAQLCRFLRRVSLVRGAHIDLDAINHLADALVAREYAAGEVIIREGELGEHFFIVATGAASVTDAGGRELSQRGPGAYFGESSLLSGELTMATVTAGAFGCSALSLDADAFQRLLGPSGEAHVQGGSFRKYEPAGRAVANAADDAPLQPRAKGEDYQSLRVLGQGAFGTVSLVRHVSDGALLASKAISKRNALETEQVQQSIAERDVHEAFESPHVVQLHASYQTHESLVFVLELAAGGELFEHIRRCGRLTTEQAQIICLEVLQGLAYLHTREIPVLYRDLKPENVLIGADGHARLADFGFAKPCLASEKSWTFCGTPEYMAPELVTHQGYGQGADVWALGVLLYECLTSYSPFCEKDDGLSLDVFQRILRGKVRYKFGFNKDAERLLRGVSIGKEGQVIGNRHRVFEQGVLVLDPEKRLGLAQVEQSVFFKDVQLGAPARGFSVKWLPEGGDEEAKLAALDRAFDEIVIAPPRTRPLTASEHEAFNGF